MFVLQTGPGYHVRRNYVEREGQPIETAPPEKKNPNLRQPIVRQQKGREEVLAVQKISGVRTASAYVWDMQNAYEATIYTDAGRGSAAVAKANVAYDSNSQYREIVARVTELAWTLVPANNKRLDQLDWRNRDIVMADEDRFVVLANQFGPSNGTLTLGFEYNYMANLKTNQALDGGEFSAVLTKVDANSAYVQVVDKASGQPRTDPQIPLGGLVDSGYTDPASGNPLYLHVRSVNSGSGQQTADLGVYTDVYVLAQGKRPNNVSSDAPGPDSHYIVGLGSADGTYRRTGTIIGLIAEDVTSLHGGENRLRGAAEGREGEYVLGPSILRNSRLYNDGLNKRQGEKWSIESASGETLVLADESDPNVANGRTDSGTYLHFAAGGGPLFGLIYNGTSSGRITDIKMKVEDGRLFYKAEGSQYFVLKPMPEGITVGGMKVAGSNVSGDGAVIYIDPVNKRVGLTANARPDIATANFVYTYVPYSKGLYDYQFDQVQHKGLGESAFSVYESPLWDQRTDKIAWTSSTKVEIDFSKDITTSTNQLRVQYDKRVKPTFTGVAETRRPLQRAERQLSFGMYDEVRIPVLMQNPERADVRISNVSGAHMDVYVLKNNNGFTLFPGALVNPGTYTYTVTENGHVSRGVFSIRP